MSGAAIFVDAFGVACALGADKESVGAQLFSAAPPLVHDRALLIGGREVPIGRVPFEFDASLGGTRTNRILTHCYAEIADAVRAAREAVGADRLGVVIGTSTSGIGEGGEGVKLKLSSGAWPEKFSLQPQQLDDPARHAAMLASAEGPCFAISTACTSGARALAAGARLIRAGFCDYVLCGGVDSVCDLTLNGFASLDSISSTPCNPMSVNRNGINIGEGAALFLLTRDARAFRLSGWGESADSYHISAPDPAGSGAETALRKALAMAGAAADEIDFVHLHGTATRLNDAMEAGVVHRMFGEDIPAASTKPMTGHTLGAAGALQAAFCVMALEQGRLPPHLWDGEHDPDLPNIRLVQAGETFSGRHAISASYAFGGNNAAFVVSRA
jgi:3-oxoacyl-[acyl-carrier-protein] synthase-1